MTLFEARPPDLRKERLRQQLVWGGIILIAVLAVLGFVFRHWRVEHTVDNFLTKIEQKDYNAAYAIWNADPDWEKHPERYQDYTFGQFQLDWGPTGDFGNITSHKVEGSVEPRSSGKVTGVVVAARINNRAEPACLWVDKQTRAISFSPIDCTF
jgi:hypothetical protein